jgi:hypothetical protein
LGFAKKGEGKDFFKFHSLTFFSSIRNGEANKEVIKASLLKEEGRLKRGKPNNLFPIFLWG